MTYMISLTKFRKIARELGAAITANRRWPTQGVKPWNEHFDDRVPWQRAKNVEKRVTTPMIDANKKGYAAETSDDGYDGIKLYIAYVCQLWGQSIYNRHIATSFWFYLTDHGLKNDSPWISYILSYRQKIKVQILTLLSSKGQYLGFFTFEIFKEWECQKNVTKTATLVNPLTSCRTDRGEKARN